MPNPYDKLYKKYGIEDAYSSADNANDDEEERKRKERMKQGKTSDPYSRIYQKYGMNDDGSFSDKNKQDEIQRGRDEYKVKKENEQVQVEDQKRKDEMSFVDKIVDSPTTQKATNFVTNIVKKASSWWDEAAFKMNEQSMFNPGRKTSTSIGENGKMVVSYPRIDVYNNAKDDNEKQTIMEESKDSSNESNTMLKFLNSDTGKAITGQVARKTSDIPLKVWAGIKAIGDDTYDEAYASLLASKNDPNNGRFKRIMYGIQDGGVQSAVGVLLAVGTSFITRNPQAGKMVSMSYFSSVSAESQRKEKGEVDSLGNIAIDTAGDMVLGNIAEATLKNVIKEGGEATITNFLKQTGKGFIVEGVTEPSQSFLKYANDYKNEKTNEGKKNVVSELVNYVKSGGMTDEFLIGGLSGAGIQATATGVGMLSKNKIDADPSLQPKKSSDDEKDNQEDAKEEAPKLTGELQDDFVKIRDEVAKLQSKIGDYIDDDAQIERMALLQDQLDDYQQAFKQRPIYITDDIQDMPLAEVEIVQYPDGKFSHKFSADTETLATGAPFSIETFATKEDAIKSAVGELKNWATESLKNAEGKDVAQLNAILEQIDNSQKPSVNLPIEEKNIAVKEVESIINDQESIKNPKELDQKINEDEKFYPNKDPEKGVKIYGSIKNKIAKISSIEISKVKQKNGLGTKYVNQFEAWANENGADRVEIEAYKKSVGFWEKMGYELEKEFPIIGGSKQDFKKGVKIINKKNTGKSEINDNENSTQTAGGKTYNSNKESKIQKSPLKVKFKKNGSFTFANEKIESPADVAFAFRQLKNEAVENLIAIGLKGDKPITVEIISIGTLNTNLVHPREVTALLKAKGADGVYYMHNHPSGEIDPSDNDYNTTRRLRGVHKELGIEYKGHIIIDTDKFGFIDADLNYTAQKHLEAGKNPTKVSSYKKYLEWVKDAKFGPTILGPRDSYEIYKGIRLSDKNVMALFLDARNRILTSQVFPINKSTTEKIFEHSMKYPTASVIVGGNNLKNSLGEIKSKMTENGIELLDIININKKDGSYLTINDAHHNGSFSDFNELNDKSVDKTLEMHNISSKVANIKSENELLGGLKKNLKTFHEMGIEDSAEVNELIEKLEDKGLTQKEKLDGFELLKRAETKIKLVKEKQEALKKSQENKVKNAREKALEAERLGRELRESLDLGLLDIEITSESVTNEDIDVILSEENVQKEINKVLKNVNPFLKQRMVINIANEIFEYSKSGKMKLSSAGIFNKVTGNITISQNQKAEELETTIAHEILHNSWMYLTNEERAEVAKYYKDKPLEEKRELMGKNDNGQYIYDLYVESYGENDESLIEEMGVTEAALKTTTNKILIRFKKIVESFIRLINKISANKIFNNEVKKLNALSIFKEAFKNSNFFEGRSYRYPDKGFSISLNKITKSESVKKETSTRRFKSIVDKRSALLKQKNKIEKDFNQSEEGVEVSEKIIVQSQKAEDANIDVIKGIKNNSTFKKEGTITDEMGSGFLMRKGERTVVVESKKVNRYLERGYRKSIEIDSLAAEAGFEDGVSYLENELTKKMPYSLETEQRRVLQRSNSFYGKIIEELKKTEDDLNKAKDDKSAFYLGMRIGSAKMKETYKAKIATFKSRKNKVRAIKDFFNLSDNQFKKIGGNRDLQYMTEAEFNGFLNAMGQRSEEEMLRSQARELVVAQIQEKQLKKYDNLRRAMKLPKIQDMTTKQLQEFDRALEDSQFGDEFFTQRQLETVKNTELIGIKTVREAKEKLAERLGMPLESLGKISVAPLLDRLRYDSALADVNPFYKMLVDETNTATLSAEKRFIEIEHEINKLIKAARKSRKRKLVDRLAPKDDLIFSYLESSDKASLAKEMTSQELEAAEFIRRSYEEMRDYLVASKMMETSKENYITHMRRGFLETYRDDGIVSAFKSIFEQYQEDQAIFNILNSDTGQILPLEKFFQYTLRRTGNIKPSQNVAKVFLNYAQAFEKKMALDSLIPKLDIYTYSIQPKQMTPRGLLMDRSLKKFLNEWMNNKKGRKFDFGGALAQGGKADLSIRFLKAITSILDLGLSVPAGIASNVGEQSTNYVMLGTKNYALGRFRMHTKKGRAIIKQTRNFVGKNPWTEIAEASKTIGDQFNAGLFILFRDAQVRANKQYLLGSLSNEEYNSGKISDERLAELKREMGRWRVVEGSKSILGNTSAGGVFTQYKTWAIPILRTTLKDISDLIVNIKKDGVKAIKSREGAELLRSVIIMGGLGLILKSLFSSGKDTEKEKSFSEKLIDKSVRDMLSTIGALDPTFFISEPRIMSFLVDMSSAIKQTITLETYSQDGAGYEEGDLKGANKVKKLLTPAVIKQISPGETSETDKKEKLIKAQVKSGKDPIDIADNVAQQLGYSVDSDDYKQKWGKIKADAMREEVVQKTGKKTERLVKARLKTSKIKILKEYQENMSSSEFKTYLETLYDGKVISKAIYDEF
jgi:DNA repair protein RadC